QSAALTAPLPQAEGARQASALRLRAAVGAVGVLQPGQAADDAGGGDERHDAPSKDRAVLRRVADRVVSEAPGAELDPAQGGAQGDDRGDEQPAHAELLGAGPIRTLVPG